jgi:hypothetical protein
MKSKIKRVKSNGVAVKDNRKIKSKKIVIDGMEFDSLLEGRCYVALRDAGIKFEVQKEFPIIPSFKYCGKAIRPMRWTADYYLPDLNIVCEAKGLPNESFPLRLKMFMWRYSLEKGGGEPEVFLVKNSKEIGDFINYVKEKMSK